MSAAEPVRGRYANPLARFVAATRPAFLSVTLVGAILGTSLAAWHGAGLRAAEALVAIVFALVAHAGVNVLNDYFDSINGSDDANLARLFPYTGGSRMIQNGVMTRSETLALGVLLCAAVVPAGLWLVAGSGAGLLAIGAAGLAIGWMYSAPPFALMARGLGEVAVATGFLLVVAGAAYVQSGALDTGVLVAGASYALLVANLLFVNEFPDREADAGAGKRTLVVRLGVGGARWCYAAIALGAHILLVIAVLSKVLPWAALVALVSAVPCAIAVREVLRHAAEPALLVRAIRATIAAALIHGAAVTLALVATTLGGGR
jgi:1,4-dihydroxy-2-naphthoate octaprenyltransferase